MEVILCIPVVAVIISFLAWLFIRENVPFSRLPLTEYRLLLESVVFFIPAAATGWYSAQLAQVILESYSKILTVLWLIGMLVVFIVMGILELSIGVKKAPKDMGNHDLIAIGLGYLAGLLFGGNQVLVRHTRPPQYLYTLWNELARIFLFICLGSIVFFSLLVILLLYMNSRQKKAKRLKGISKRKKELAAPAMEPDDKVLLTGKDQTDVDESPTG